MEIIALTEGKVKLDQDTDWIAELEKPVVWREEFSVGNEHLNSDHKTILILLQDFKDAVRRKSDDDYIKTVFNNLMEYTERHFAEEEAYMAEISYSGLEEHRSRHLGMKAELKSLRIDYEDQRDAFNFQPRIKRKEEVEYSEKYKATIKKLVRFMNNWWQNHILDEDMNIKAQAGPSK